MDHGELHLRQPELYPGRRRLSLRPKASREGLYFRRLGVDEDLYGLSSHGTRAESRHRSEVVLFASEEINSAPLWRELEPETLVVAHRDLRLEFHCV